MSQPVFHLALVDRAGEVRLVWQSTAEAHRDLADVVAAKVHPRRWQARKRRKSAAAIRAHLLELQQQTVSLAADEPEATA